MIIYRPPTLEDLTAVVSLTNAYTTKWVNRSLKEEVDFRQKWHSQDFELERNARLAVDGDLVVGYIEIYPRRRYLINFLDCFVHPDYADRGIDDVLYDWAEAQTNIWLNKAPSSAQVIIRVGIIWRDEGAQALLRRRQYQLVRHFQEMAIEFDEKPVPPHWPNGIHVRPFQIEDARRVAAAHQESFSDHWGAVPMSEEEYYATWQERLKSAHFSPDNWFIAWDGAEVAGFNLCRSMTPENPQIAWVDALGVRRAWRGRGLGLALLLHSFQVFYERGKKGVGLNVDSDSPTGATQLYLKAGMKPTMRIDVYDKIIQYGEDLTNRG